MQLFFSPTANGQAHCGSVLEAAEVVSIQTGAELIALQLSRRARTIFRHHDFVPRRAACVFVVGALPGQMSLTLGVIGHEGSTVVAVVLNSLRLLFAGQCTPSLTPVEALRANAPSV